MKSFMIFFLFFAFNTFLSAQIQITQPDVENIFAAGTSWLNLSSEDPMTNMDIGSASSTSQNWSIPIIDWSDTTIAMNVTPASTPYQSHFSDATHAQFATGYFEGSPATQYSFYKIESDGLYEIGRALEINLGGTDTVLIETGNELVFPFPLTYGLVLEDSRDSVDIGGGVYNIILRLSSVDAFGNLTFPFGSFQALRVSNIETTTVYFNGTVINEFSSGSFSWIAKEGTFEADIDTNSSTSGNVPLYSASVTQFNYIPTSTNEDFGRLPSGFQLYQNYPNPFNPSTNIKFTVSRSAFVSLKVYDLLGNEASNLVNDVRAPGVYTVNFDASTLSSGTYFYRLQIRGLNISITKKLILVK